MSSGQTRVLVLLIILAFLEAAAHPAVKSFFKAFWAAIGTSVANSQKAGSA